MHAACRSQQAETDQQSKECNKAPVRIRAIEVHKTSDPYGCEDNRAAGQIAAAFLANQHKGNNRRIVPMLDSRFARHLLQRDV